MANAGGGDLTPGELQVCSLLVSKALATTGEREGQVVYRLGPEIHEQLLETLPIPGLRLRTKPHARIADAPHPERVRRQRRNERSLDLEGTAAAAGGFHLRIVKLEPGAFQRLYVIDFRTV